MVTKFIHATVPLWEGLELHVDGNSKITWDNGSYAEPKPNAFSLPHIATCPGSTDRCRSSCYVHGLKKHAPEVYRTYELNEMALHRVFMTVDAFQRSAAIFGDWIAEHCQGGFRWHVSGDIMHARHAAWILNVCLRAKDVPFWIYTRTISAVDTLVEAPNLAVNVSVDRDNYEFVQQQLQAFGTAFGFKPSSVRLCYLVSSPDEVIPELPAGSVVFPDYPLRGRELDEPTSHPWWQALSIENRRMVCPADFQGQSEQHRCGPCKHCLRPAGAS